MHCISGICNKTVYLCKPTEIRKSIQLVSYMYIDFLHTNVYIFDNILQQNCIKKEIEEKLFSFFFFKYMRKNEHDFKKCILRFKKHTKPACKNATVYSDGA